MFTGTQNRSTTSLIIYVFDEPCYAACVTLQPITDLTSHTGLDDAEGLICLPATGRSFIS